ncbi:MAG: tRNA preQ1(34) S-adenosylmethionine ribosyltransferase-isomerase QueA [Bacteroidetes bacterium]|nr:tRNA preQ1(34) S-adenosylmethionine ribosyltransferase-isomerase QueA [Bacteroidota bacterium]
MVRAKETSIDQGDDTRIGSYDYHLPESQIAQHPTEKRDESRMLVLDRDSGAVKDRIFRDIVEYIRPEDVLVLNNTKVFPARLVGEREPGGGKAELFLVRPAGDGVWDALARPGSKLRKGARVRFGDELRAEVLEVLDDGRRRVRFEGEGRIDALIERAGRMPLPPYIRRDEPDPADRERYQTVYAREKGAVAAPTAGLHFTPDILNQLRGQSTTIAEVTLHVGYGTFEPVRVDDLRNHTVASEWIDVPEAAAEAINAARERGGRVIAVGTTSTRTLESAADKQGRVQPFSGETNLTITPGYQFRVVDALLTNFHLPRSSLLVLVSAFAGRENVLTAYQHAVEEGYRFYSYGDCMLIVQADE